MGAYPPNVSGRSVISAGTLVKLWAFSSGAASAISHESLKAPLWVCEPVRSLTVSLLKCQDTSWRGHPWGPSAPRSSGKPCLGALSHLYSQQLPLRGHDSWDEWDAGLFFTVPSNCRTSSKQEGAMPGIRVGLLCLWPVPGHKFGAGGQSDCRLLWGWKGGRRRWRRRDVGNAMKS